MSEPLRIGAVFIAYNAAGTLEKFWNEFPREMVETAILVDDASQDGTFELAQRLGIRAYRNDRNLGYGGNLKRALSIARELGMNTVVDLHPDGEYEPSAIGPALERVKAGADLVLGNRFGTGVHPVRRGMFAWKVVPLLVLNAAARRILAVPLTDLHQGFRVYGKRLLTEVDYQGLADDYLFSFELIAKVVFAGMRIEEVPVGTRYAGKKRGASLRASAAYSLGVAGVLGEFIAARAGLRTRRFGDPASFRAGTVR